MVGQCCSLSCQEKQEILKTKCIFTTDNSHISNLKYIICFTGNSDEFISQMVLDFVEVLTNVAENESVILCEPVEYLAEKLKNSICNGQICDMNSLMATAREKLNVKFKLLQDNLNVMGENHRYLIINGLLNAEEIIMIQEQFCIEPIIIEIFDSNRFRNIDQIPRKSIRSSLRLNINSKNDAFILYQSMVDYLFKALNLDATYKSFPECSLSQTVVEFDRLQVASSLLFHRCFKKVYPDGSSLPICMPKSPYELEDSINPVPVGEWWNNEYYE